MTHARGLLQASPPSYQERSGFSYFFVGWHATYISVGNEKGSTSDVCSFVTKLWFSVWTLSLALCIVSCFLWLGLTWLALVSYVKICHPCPDHNVWLMDLSEIFFFFETKSILRIIQSELPQPCWNLVLRRHWPRDQDFSPLSWPNLVFEGGVGGEHAGTTDCLKHHKRIVKPDPKT